MADSFNESAIVHIFRAPKSNNVFTIKKKI